MSQSLGIHDLASIVCTLGGVRIKGTTDDGIEIGPVTAETIANGISADGAHPFVEITNDNRFVMTFSVYQTSAAYARLAQLQAEQAADVFNNVTDPFARRAYFNNPRTGDKCVSNRLVFTNRPPLMGKKANQPVQFLVFLPNPTITRGASILG
jgi:hypothetical protein